jgi:hypothetical protein
MSNPAAFVLLDQPSKIDPTRLREALTARHPDLKIMVTEDGPATAVVVTVPGSVVAVMARDAPLPDGWQEVAAQSAMQWPEAEATCAKHRAHFLVSVMGDDEDQLEVARATTAVAGALVESHSGCSAVLWSTVVAHPSRTFADLSRSAFADYPQFPSGLWVLMNPFRDSGSPNVGVVTTGLQRFVGREVEFEAKASQFKFMLETVHALVTYLVEFGARVRDGDTIGETSAERITLRLKQSHRFEGLPVYAATLAG